jgi:hypothetical protein
MTRQASEDDKRSVEVSSEKYEMTREVLIMLVPQRSTGAFKRLYTWVYTLGYSI